MNESLEYIPMERWDELEKLFETDWPRSISVLAALKTQRYLEKIGLGYGFKVYCPQGNPANGMVVINKKDRLNEIILYCPQNSINNLENALLTTNLVEWKEPFLIPFLPKDIFNLMERISKNVNVEIESEIEHPPHHVVLLDKETPLYENVVLPDDIHCQLLEDKHVNTVESVWPNRNEASKWLFHLLIKAKFGHGLFKNNILASCVFINEVGSLCHMYTFEEYRNNGYGTMLLKLVCNEQLMQKRHVFGYCHTGNNVALQLYKKLGFKVLHTIQWCFVNPK